ncbi:MAG: hypothetical protein PWQ87_124 [Candidatus Woesearchaeota archaeon]|nr:hypothetical protein [Candidatus Woesearchaeota archaeon]
MMEQGVLFTSVKWDVLKELSQSDMSPIELSSKSSTSMSNISQALRLLEIAGLVKSKRIPNRDKGQPRVVYSLQKDFAYLVVVTKEFAEKKLLELDPRKKSILRIWLYDDEITQFFMEEALNALLPFLDDISGIYYDKNSSSNEISIVVLPKNETLKELPSDIIKTFHGIKKKIEFSELKKNEAKKKISSLYAIYDPLKFRGGEKS